MSKVFRHVITGLVSILLDAIILKSRLVAQGSGGSVREKGRGRRGDASSVRASTERRIRAAGSSATNIIAAKAKAWKRPLQSARAQLLGRRHSLPLLPPSLSYRTPQPWHYCALTLTEKAGDNRPFPARGPRYLEGSARAGKKETRVSAAQLRERC